MHARRLGGPEQRPHVLRILERVQHEHERRLAALVRECEDIVGRGPAARGDHERDPLVPVEPGDRGERTAFDLDDGDAQAGGVEDELLERHPALRHDEQAPSLPAGDECLLDGAAARDELLTLPERDALEGAGRGRRGGGP